MSSQQNLLILLLNIILESFVCFKLVEIYLKLVQIFSRQLILGKFFENKLAILFHVQEIRKQGPT